MKHFTCLRVTPVLLALFLCAILPASRAATYYVATSGSDAAAGTNWATAKVTIQAAVNLTTNGDLVLVSNGVYSTGATLPSGLTISNRVMITNQIILQSANGPAVTQITGSYASGASPANVRCLLFDCPTGMISGFTLYSGGTLETSNSTSSTFNNDGGGVWAGRDHQLRHLYLGRLQWRRCVWRHPQQLLHQQLQRVLWRGRLRLHRHWLLPL
jgi:hypothetical protein